MVVVVVVVAAAGEGVGVGAAAAGVDVDVGVGVGFVCVGVGVGGAAVVVGGGFGGAIGAGGAVRYMFWEKDQDQIDAIKRFLLERVKGRRTAGSSATDLDAMTHMLTMVKFKMGPAMRMPKSPQFAQAGQAATTLVQATIDCYRSETEAQRRRSLESDKASGEAAKDFRNFWVDEGDSLSVEGEASKPMDLNALEALLQSAWELDFALQLSEEGRKASLAILIGGPEVVMAK